MTLNRCKMLTPDQYDSLIKKNMGLLVVGYLSDDLISSRQMQILADFAQSAAKRVTCAILNPAYGSYFEKNLKLDGSPTFLLFFAGMEQRRFLGSADFEDLRELASGPAGDVAL
ncbi:hypothetical protein [Maridesulfovibrio sp.]|uniref:hypothetical protein n=1 Tax=Maridesulfovibrio sp. TaxID=2795000 RepID=UPI002A186DAB|nr:hypothetical protein [Maridesulfovibrio sp.]